MQDNACISKYETGLASLTISSWIYFELAYWESVQQLYNKILWQKDTELLKITNPLHRQFICRYLPGDSVMETL